MSVERREHDRVMPILGSRDLGKTAAFYAALGFSECGRWPEYLILTRDWIELHFYLDPNIDPLSTASSCYIRTTNALDLYTDFSAVDLPTEGTPRLMPAWQTDYGMTEFALIDLDGNLIRIGRVDKE